MNEKINEDIKMNVSENTNVFIAALLEIFLEHGDSPVLKSPVSDEAKELYRTRLLSYVLGKLNEQDCAQWENWEQGVRDGINLPHEKIHGQFMELEQGFLYKIWKACEVTVEFLRELDKKIKKDTLSFAIMDRIIIAYLYGTQANGDEVCDV